MKLHKLLLVLFAFSLTLAGNSVVAQDDGMEEMTMEQWQQEMDELTVRKNDLMNQLNGLNRDIDALKKQNTDKDAELTKAENDLYGAVGTTKSGVADFRGKFEAAEKRVNGLNCATAKQDDIDAVNKDLAAITASKIRCLPEFWSRWEAMKKKMDGCKPAAPSCYTVVKGDCLYKIAGMKNIYGNSRLWPAIWEANKTKVADMKMPPANKRTPNKVTNPNLIYPGQCLNIPNLTDAQKKDILSKKWNTGKWRRKTTMKKTTETGTTKTDEKKDTKGTDKK